MIGTIQNIVSNNNDITVFYTISDDTYLLEENAHFKNTTPIQDIISFIDNRKTEIENRPAVDYQPYIGEVIE